MVDLIFPRWNPLTSWMRRIEDFQRPHSAVCQTEARLSSHLDFPRKSFTILYFPDRASWLALAPDTLVLARLRDNRGDSSIRDDCRRRCAGLTVPGNRPPDAVPSNCRNPQKERLRQEVRGTARFRRNRPLPPVTLSLEVSLR